MAASLVSSIISSSDNKTEFARLVNSIRSAPMGVCKDVIASIKKEIKSKSVLPPGKLKALQLFHACMMTGNTDFLLFASKKVMQRFTILARHKKLLQDENRGNDLFGNLSVQSAESAQASAEFLRTLLISIRAWAHQFGSGPDGQPSAFYKAYKALEAEGVKFPPAESKNRRSSQPARPAYAREAEEDFGFVEDHRLKPAPPRPIVERPSADNHRPKGLKKDFEAIRSSVELMREMLEASEPDRETLDVLAATLRSHVSQLETLIGSTQQGEEIESLFEANDSIRETLEQYERFKNRGSAAPKARVEPKPQPRAREEPKASASLLDLNFDAPVRPQPAAYQTEALSSSFANNPFLSVRPQPSDAHARPAYDPQALSLQPAKPVQPPQAEINRQSEQLQRQYEARLAEAEGRVKEAKQFAEALQNSCRQKDGEVALLRAQIDDLLAENRRLKEDLVKAQKVSISPRNDPLLSAPPNLSPFASSNSSHSRSSDLMDSYLPSPKPLPKAQIITNDAAFPSLWSSDRGILVDTAQLQVGYKLQVQGSEARMMMYVGNKSAAAMEELTTSLVYSPGQGIEMQVDKEEEQGVVVERGKADRMIRVRASNFYPEVPRLSLRFVTEQREVKVLLQLPLTVLRFLSAPRADPSQVLQMWSSLEPTAALIPFTTLHSAFDSLQALAQAFSAGDCFQVLSKREAPELEGALLACGHKDSAILFIKMQLEGSLEVRSNTPRLRECAVTLLPSLLVAQI